MAPGTGEASLTDSLARGLADGVARVARQLGQAPPVVDARLGAVAEILAGTLTEDEIPGLELQEFLLSHHGLGEPAPHLSMLRVAASDAAITQRLTEEATRVLAAAPFGRMGVGVVRHWPQVSVVLALQPVDVELLPVPRRLDPADSAMVAGRLLHGLHTPRVLVAPPTGDVRPLEVRQSRDSFQASFACQGLPGRHQLEILGTGPTGKTVVANFAVYCGAEPPQSAPRGGIRGPESQDPATNERLLVDLVNRDRAAAGLPQLNVDPALSRVAQAHSAEQAEKQVVQHVSPATGSAADRLRRAGVPATVVLENVARASSIADAQRSFMTSPGHRANVLDRTVDRVGVAVVIRPEPGGFPSVYVTELFAR